MTKNSTYNAPLQRPLDRIALLGIAIAILSAFAAALAGMGHRLGWWHFSTGFSMLTGATFGALISIGFSLGGILRTRLQKKARRGFWQALLGLLIGLTVASIPLYWWYMARSVPPIHDITTDTDNPPDFSALLPLRAEAPNPSQYGGPTVAIQQQKAYPDLKSLPLSLNTDQALEEAVAVAQKLGWNVIAVTVKEDHKIILEATDTTPWFGFVDDIVIRIIPLDKGSRVDVRSVSRVGRSDVGTNARRVRTFLKALKKRAAN
jgi:uncharacterized protein (DUF1499 family)